MKYLYLTITTLTLICNSVTNANINHNWNELSNDQYIDNLVNCQLKIKEFEWSHSIWLKENKNAKPQFLDIVNTEEILEKVIMNLNKQSVLENSFNLVVDENLLKSDIIRMTKNIKDAKRLKEIFSLLDNNPTTIVQCISRPYLVDKLLNN